MTHILSLPWDVMIQTYEYLPVNDIFITLLSTNLEFRKLLGEYIQLEKNTHLQKLQDWHKNKIGWNNYELATQNGEREVVEYMIGKLRTNNLLDDNILHTLATIAAFKGDVALLQWVISVTIEEQITTEGKDPHIIHWNILPCDCWVESSIKGDQPEVLQWIINEGSLAHDTENLWRKVVKFKAFKILEALHKWSDTNPAYQIHDNTSITEHAIEGGDIGIVQSVISLNIGNGTNPSHLMLAARLARNDIFKWLRTTVGLPWERSGVEVLREYVRQGDICMYYWCLHQGAQPDTSVLMMAATKKCWDLVKGIILGGVGCDSFVLRVVCAHGNLHLLKWILHHTPSELSESIIEGACKNGHIHIVAWYYRQGYTFTTLHLYQAGNAQHRKTTEFILNRMDVVDRVCYNLLQKKFPHHSRIQQNLQKKFPHAF